MKKKTLHNTGGKKTTEGKNERKLRKLPTERERKKDRERQKERRRNKATEKERKKKI